MFHVWLIFLSCNDLHLSLPHLLRSRAVPRPHKGSFSASHHAESPASGIVTPHIPLLPLWEKGEGGMRGKQASGCGKHPSRPQNSTPANRAIRGKSVAWRRHPPATCMYVQALLWQNIDAQSWRARSNRTDLQHAHLPPNIAPRIAARRRPAYEGAFYQKLHALSRRQDDAPRPRCICKECSPRTGASLRAVAGIDIEEGRIERIPRIECIFNPGDGHACRSCIAHLNGPGYRLIDLNRSA